MSAEVASVPRNRPRGEEKRIRLGLGANITPIDGDELGLVHNVWGMENQVGTVVAGSPQRHLLSARSCGQLRMFIKDS